MDQESRPAVEFAAVLRPHRSLSRQGFVILMSVIGGVGFATGVLFLALGAWPVIGFLGLDVLIVYWAFRRNFADAEVREAVEVTAHEVILYRLRPGKPAVEQRFPRVWVRVELDQDEERELVGPLALKFRGRRTEFGSFLAPEERQSLAAALKAALARPRI
jgi:uncharacterized membrane protein